MYNRKGQISVIRIGLFAGLFGILIIAAAVIAVARDTAARQVPLDIELYPNAAEWGMNNVRETSRKVFYRVAAPPEDVAAYYQQKLEEHYGNNDQRCVRLPAQGTSPGSDTNRTIVPYQFICLFDNSGFQSSQYTRVLVYPGLPNDDPFLHSEGLTVIEYEQQWQR